MGNSIVLLKVVEIKKPHKEQKSELTGWLCVVRFCAQPPAADKHQEQAQRSNTSESMDAELQKLLTTEGDVDDAAVAALVDKIAAAHDPALVMRAVELRLFLACFFAAPFPSIFEHAAQDRDKQCAATR